MSKNQKVTEVAKPENKIQHQIAKWVVHGFDDQREISNQNKVHKRPVAIIIYSQSLHNHFPKISEQDTKGALKFDFIKTSLKKYQGFKVPQTQPFCIDENLVKTIQVLLTKIKNTSKLSLFLIDHGAPGWFFAPYTLYFREKVGFCWEFDKNLLQHSHYILDKHDFYYYCYSNNTKTKIFLDDSKVKKLHGSINKSAVNGLFKKNAIDELTTTEMEWIEGVTNQNFIQTSEYRAEDLHLSEHSNARFFAKIISEIETQLNIKFSSIHLHSCNSAAEFMNYTTKDKIISSARILSIYLQNHLIFGNIGYNSDYKTTHLWVKENEELTPKNPSLEDTIVVYKDNKVILKPKKQFFANLNDLSAFTQTIYSEEDEPYVKYEYFEDAPKHSILSKFGLYGPKNHLDGLNKFYDTSCLVPN